MPSQPDSPKPTKQDTFEFEPAYEDINGIKHEFTGLLWTPAPGEAAKIEAKQAEENPQDLTNYTEYVTTVLQPFPNQWRTKRVQMSAKDLIRLNASRSK